LLVHELDVPTMDSPIYENDVRAGSDKDVSQTRFLCLCIAHVFMCSCYSWKERISHHTEMARRKDNDYEIRMLIYAAC
jgi:uncharacterized protein involved in tolerance to divalent cations